MMSGNLLLDLSGSWQFAMGPAESAVFSQETVLLPGTMDENGKGLDNRGNFTSRHLNRDYVYTGPAVYQREVSVPAEWAGRPIFLHLERTKKTRVWVDGQSAGGQQRSYTTPHCYDLTALCRPGRTHTLTVEVDNSSDGMPYAMYSTLWEGEAWCQLTEHGQTNWNGMVGALRLESPPALSVSALRLRPDLSRHNLRAEVTLTRLDGAEELRGEVVLQAESWNTDQPIHKTVPQRAGFCFAAGERTAVLDLLHDMGERPLLWDEFHPNLYRVTAEVWQDGVLCAQAEEDFGMRSFTAGANQGGRQFFINGRPTQLRGEINCAIFPKTGYAPMGLEDWLRVFAIYKDYGLNHVRFHTWVPPRAAFQAADRLGLYLYVELPHWGRRMFGDIAQGDDTDVRYYEGDTRRIFAEYGNSPSFVMFALGNEERIGFYYYEEFLKFCKGLEPGLLYSDIAGHSTYPPSADFASKWLEPGYLPLTQPRTDWDYDQAVQAAPVPITGHEVGQLQVYPDYDRELPAYEGSVLRPRNLEHFRNILAQAGLADRAGDFHRATGKLAAMLYRRFVESYLRTPGSGGFLLLGLQDFSGQGTALVGLLDSFLERKGAIAPEDFRRSCCELAVLARLPRFVWEGGDALTAEILVSNYSPAPAELALSWVLEDDRGTVLARGGLPARPVPQGGVTRLGALEAELPQLSAPCRAQLVLSLEGEYDALFAPGVNDYPLWLYPAAPQAELPEGVVLCRSYDRQAERALAQGKTVLVISEGTAAALPRSRAVSFRPDFWSPMFHTAQSDGYSLGIFVDENHPLFTNFPTDCFGDWQWFGPLENARGLLINELPPDLRPMVQPIAAIDLPERLAMLFEARVGPGRLLVSTVDLLEKEDPASRALLSAIYRYVGGGAFQPETALEPELLRPYLPPLELTSIRLRGVRRLDAGERAALFVDCFDSRGPCGLPEGWRLTFQNSNPSVAQVDEAGHVLGLGPGIAKLSAVCAKEAAQFADSLALRVGEPSAQPVSLEGAVITASSSHPQHPVTDMLNDDPDAFWQTNYLDRTQRLPQWVEIALPEAREVCALLCGAWTGSTRGAILRATLSVSLDGKAFETVCRGQWAESAAGEDKLFAFPPRPVRFLRLDVEWAVMHTGDSNAVSISHLALYDGPLIAALEERPVCPVQFGTALERALEQAALPEHVFVTLADGSRRTAQVVWVWGAYHPDQPGDYAVEGALFCPGAANPGGLRARQVLRVLPKDMTTPLDKTELDRLSLELRAQLDSLLAQVESFAALTGAVQHDVDVWADTVGDAIRQIRSRSDYGRFGGT